MNQEQPTKPSSSPIPHAMMPLLQRPGSRTAHRHLKRRSAPRRIKALSVNHKPEIQDPDGSPGHSTAVYTFSARPAEPSAGSSRPVWNQKLNPVVLPNLQISGKSPLRQEVKGASDQPDPAVSADDWISRTLNMSISSSEEQLLQDLQAETPEQEERRLRTFKQAKAGDLILCRMPLSPEQLEKIPPGHERRPYLIVEKKADSLFGYPCTGRASSFELCLKNGKKTDRESDSHIFFEQFIEIPATHVIRPVGSLMERMWPEADKRIAIQQYRSPESGHKSLGSSWSFAPGDLVETKSHKKAWIISVQGMRLQAIFLKETPEHNDILLQTGTHVYGMKPGAATRLSARHVHLIGMTVPENADRINRMLLQERPYDGRICSYMVRPDRQTKSARQMELLSRNHPHPEKLHFKSRSPMNIQSLSRRCEKDMHYFQQAQSNPALLQSDHTLARHYKDAMSRLFEAMDPPNWEAGTIFTSRKDSSEWIYLFTRQKKDYGIRLSYYSSGRPAKAELEVADTRLLQPSAYAAWREMDKYIRQLFFQYPQWRLSLMWAMEIFEAGESFVWPQSIRKMTADLKMSADPSSSLQA